MKPGMKRMTWGESCMLKLILRERQKTLVITKRKGRWVGRIGEKGIKVGIS